ELVWKRDDLRRFYGLKFAPGLQSLFGYFDGKSALRIDPRTGETLETFRGVNYVAASAFRDSTLFGNNKSFILRNDAGQRLWSLARASFAVLDVGWSQETVAISEVGAPLRCYSSHGELLWRYKSRKTHVSPLMYCPTRHSYVGVDFTAGTEGCFVVHWD